MMKDQREWRHASYLNVDGVFLERSLENREAMYNLSSDDGGDAPRTVGGDHIAFYAFNYGSPRALSFAAGLPWLCLVRAAGRRGWRPKSRALLRAVMKYRGL